MKLAIHHFDLPLRHPFTISRETTAIQPTVVVELNQNGCCGFGEATTNDYYGVTRETLSRSIELARDFLAECELDRTRPEDIWGQLSELVEDPFSLCAIDQAIHDLWGKLHGRPVYAMWGLAVDQIPSSCFTIGIDSIETMVAKLDEMPGWPVYKIKLGTDEDLKIVRALREHTDATFRVDANCGWSVDETLHNAKEMKTLGVEFIEQPLRADDWSGHKTLVEHAVLPIVADESCISESDIAKCVGAFHGVNIKLVKCGGLTPARRMIAQARASGLKVMVGCMTESTVGISAIAQLLPLLDYVDMDGAELLADDIATGVCVKQGVCHYPDIPGCGVSLMKDGNEGCDRSVVSN